MIEQERTHEIFSEPPEVRRRMAERLMESLIDDERDSEIETAWKEEVHRRVEEDRQTPVADIFREMEKREIGTRRFRLPAGTRLGVARELIDSLDAVNEADRNDLREAFYEAAAQSCGRILFTLG